MAYLHSQRQIPYSDSIPISVLGSWDGNPNLTENFSIYYNVAILFCCPNRNRNPDLAM